MTRADLEAAVAPLATKAALEPFATKVELQATKAELQATIATLATNAELQAAVEPLATKAALEPLATKAELAEALKNHPTHEQHRAAINEALEAWAHRLREVINQDIGRHIGAAMEEMRGWIRALEPARVSAIEMRLDGSGK